jgi:group II intron reverse transcriptase/maturase
VTARESRDRVEGERASKPEGEREGNTGHQREVPEVRSDPVRAKRQSSTRQSSWGDSHGAREVKIEKVMERVYDWGRLRMAWKQVEKNAGAAGIDKMTVEAFKEREETLLREIQERLKAGVYRFQPARRVLIEKEGTQKKRKLGIPTVMDRIVSQSSHLVLEGIFDSGFTSSNFGFRRGKSQHRAIKHVRQAVVEGRDWCVSIDLESFFDEIPHGLILRLIRRKIRDERFVTLIARALKAGVIVEGQYEKTVKGCPQGSPMSPILSNIVLNELDQELDRRGHRYGRWADDFIILVESERAGIRVMESVTRYLEGGLGLPVNKEKSKVALIKDVGFLGFQILRGKLRVSNQAREKFKRKVREMTKRNNPLSMRQVILALNEYLAGWVAYFCIQEFRQIFRHLDEWIRSRLRSIQLKKWKNPVKFQRIMIRAGYKPAEARKTWVKMDRWQSVERKEVLFTLNLGWFKRQGLMFLNYYTNRALELSFTY